MTRSELVERLIKRNPTLSHRDAERIVGVFFEEITQALADGRRVEFRGFGTFSARHRRARMARNPRTGQTLDVGEKYAPYFRVGRILHQRLNRNS